MDLTHRVFTAAMAGAAALVLGSCSSEDFSVGDNAMVLPASLLEAYPVARAFALDWSDDVFVQSAGGGFTVMNEMGLASNHSFQFHSRRRRDNLIVHLLGGIPWTQEISDPVPPPPIFVNFIPYEELLDSDDVVPDAVEEAARINTAHADSIPAATDYAARLLSTAVWPEAEYVGDPNPDLQAWRVDFLIQQEISDGAPTYFSVARFYIHPVSGVFLGAPVVPPQPELYPFPQGF